MFQLNNICALCILPASACSVIHDDEAYKKCHAIVFSVLAHLSNPGTLYQYFLCFTANELCKVTLIEGKEKHGRKILTASSGAVQCSNNKAVLETDKSYSIHIQGHKCDIWKTFTYDELVGWNTFSSDCVSVTVYCDHWGDQNRINVEANFTTYKA